MSLHFILSSQNIAVINIAVINIAVIKDTDI